MRIHIPANYPPESLVLFVMSTWHILIALLISRAGVLRRAPLPLAAPQGSAQAPQNSESAVPSLSQGLAS